jgi:site-specific recombinase XerD
VALASVSPITAENRLFLKAARNSQRKPNKSRLVAQEKCLSLKLEQAPLGYSANSEAVITRGSHKGGKEQTLARINVRAETSKVRTSRTFLCRNGQYFERLKEVTKPKSTDELIFTTDGKSELSKRALLYHWHKILDLAEIPNRDERDLVPYRLRHFMITQRIMSGLSFRQIADMCGTSVVQIERTYYHLNDEIRITNAVADYRRLEDGTIEVL